MLTRLIRRKAENYDLSEMAIAFGILSVGAIGPAMLLGLLLSHFLNLPDWSVALIVGIGLVGFVIWLWVSSVLVARDSARQRVSTVQLRRMQILCIVAVGLNAILAPSANLRHLFVMAQVFEWAIVGFHLVYFTFAWASSARVPLQTYLTFAVLLGVAWITL